MHLELGQAMDIFDCNYILYFHYKRGCVTSEKPSYDQGPFLISIVVHRGQIHSRSEISYFRASR